MRFTFLPRSDGVGNEQIVAKLKACPVDPDTVGEESAVLA